MRVLHVIPSIALEHGGPSIALPAMVRALVDSGISVDVATTDDDGRGKRKDVARGKAIQRDGVQYFLFPKQTEFYKISWPFRAWIRQRAGEYDLIHVHAVFSFASIVAARAARRAGVPYIVRPLGVLNRWGMNNRRRLVKRVSFQLVDRPALNHAAAIHYTSEQERQEAEAIGVRNRPFVLPIGLEPRLFRDEKARAAFYERRPELASRDIVLFLSRIDPKKGLDLLLAALPRIIQTRPAVCLLVAGMGRESYLAELRGEAERLGIAANVMWAGFAEGQEKAQILAVADVFVLPSYSENFGIAAVEALSAGIPTVITTGVGIAEELRSAGAAVVVRPEATELAEAVLTILGDDDFSSRLSRAARAFANRRYSIASMGRALVDMYRIVLSRQ